MSVQTSSPRLYEALLREAVDTFRTLLSKRDIDEANEMWADFAEDYAGQVELINAAQGGDIPAVNYLYLQLIPQIAGVFWNNFLGKNARHRRRRIDQGETLEYASMVYEVLLSASIQMGDEDDVKAKMKVRSGSDDVEQEYAALMGTASPLRTFDPSVFDENTDVISKFGYYLIGALKNEATKHNRRERRGGLTGKRGKSETPDDIGNVSYEGTFENDTDSAATADDFARTENEDSWERFARDPVLDSGREPTTREVLRTFLQQGVDNFDVTAVAEDFGTTNQTIRNRLAGMSSLFQKHGIDQQTFAQLLRSHGGSGLVSYL